MEFYMEPFAQTSSRWKSVSPNESLSFAYASAPVYHIKAREGHRDEKHPGVFQAIHDTIMKNGV